MLRTGLLWLRQLACLGETRKSTCKGILTLSIGARGRGVDARWGENASKNSDMDNDISLLGFKLPRTFRCDGMSEGVEFCRFGSHPESEKVPPLS
jgi:hypothetical protein